MSRENSFLSFRFGSPLAICLTTSCLAALVGGWDFVHRQPQSGHVGPEVWPAAIMFAVAVSGPLIAARRYGYAIALMSLLPIFCCFAIDDGFFMWGFHRLDGVERVVFGMSYAAICGAAVFAFIDREADCWLCGMIFMSVGVACWTGIATWANSYFPTRLVVVEIPLLLTILAFGPAMGLATGLPASYFIPRAELRRRRAANRICIDCGYDLRGSAASKICPECGTEILMD